EVRAEILLRGVTGAGEGHLAHQNRAPLFEREGDDSTSVVAERRRRVHDGLPEPSLTIPDLETHTVARHLTHPEQVTLLREVEIGRAEQRELEDEVPAAGRP